MNFKQIQDAATKAGVHYPSCHPATTLIVDLAAACAELQDQVAALRTEVDELKKQRAK